MITWMQRHSLMAFVAMSLLSFSLYFLLICLYDLSSIVSVRKYAFGSCLSSSFILTFHALCFCCLHSRQSPHAAVTYLSLSSGHAGGTPPFFLFGRYLRFGMSLGYRHIIIVNLFYLLLLLLLPLLLLKLFQAFPV